MSKLKELIAELCPNGVEYVKFDEICTYVRGITYNKSKEAKGNDFNPWKVLRANNITLSSNTLNFDDVKLIKSDVKVKQEQFLRRNDILICAGSGSKEHIGKVAFITSDMEYTFGGFMAVIRCDSQLNSRYMYHILTGDIFKKYLKYALNSTTINNLNMSVMANFQFPVPPLPVQEEIVRILDSFTSLTAELQAELQARQKQYEYYRDQLLTFDVHGGGTSEVQWKTLGEVSDIISGFPFDSSQFTESGIRLMRGMNVKRGKLDFSESNNRYWSSYDGLEKYLLDINDIVIAMDGSLVGKSFGVVTKPQLPLLLVQRVARIRVTGANSRYVYHCVINSFSSYVDSKKTEGAVPHISLKDISKFKIPTPPITIQNRIAEVLDNFDAICSDLNIGLPAEIEARQKQYEYYRDRLLSFPKLT